ncbi:glycosyltransferase family 2 protein [Pedobacter sp. PAMC26386]|nr:glycosyltransferase family 2 protein [Pedobacter sp. PAMC26386]
MINPPLVSCITPTANRQKFIPFAIDNFLKQSYPNAELVIIDDGINSNASLIPNHPKIKFFYTEPLGTIGIKRNYACGKASGEIIMHWDDDDYYAPDWINRLTDALLTSEADIAGLNRVVFYSPSVDKRWMYEDTELDKPWLCGATMTYRKSFWQQHPFIDLQVGEDYDFIQNSGAKVLASDYTEGFVAILHAHNTSIKPAENPKHKKQYC